MKYYKYEVYEDYEWVPNGHTVYKTLNNFGEDNYEIWVWDRDEFIWQESVYSLNEITKCGSLISRDEAMLFIINDGCLKGFSTEYMELILTYYG